MTIPTVGSVDLDFHGSTTLQELKDRHSLVDFKVTEFRISSKSRLLILLEESVPEPKKGDHTFFLASNRHAKMVMIVADVDWATGSLTDTRLITFPSQWGLMHLADETTDGFVIAHMRCAVGHNNAIITSSDGSVIRETCYGDGIASLVCFQDQVTVGYFDEGIFCDPISASGLVKFDLEGRILWKNRDHHICDVYAMTIDESGQLYFYYYTDFRLVKSSFDQGSEECRPHISGSDHLFVARDSQCVIMDGGYRCQKDLYAFRFDKPEEKWKVVPKFQGVALAGELKGRGSKIMTLSADSRLVFCDWVGINPSVSATSSKKG
jgi:hypothetical protein